MKIRLSPYKGEHDKACELIKCFWFEHNGYTQTSDETEDDFKIYTGENHNFYFINCDDIAVGFVHLGSRGGQPDWLEEIFVLPEYQNRGIGSKAIKLAEKEVKTYSPSLYIEAAAKNEKAIRLYRKLGYNCLNTITIRKDFDENQYENMGKENIFGMNFDIRKSK